MMKSSVLGAALLLAVSASAQTVRAGIEAWQNGDHVAAVAAWTPLAARGDADAAFNLGQAYRLGKGAAMDHDRAQRYFEQAARKGHVDAAAMLGILRFQNGDRTGAMHWLKQAADGGEMRSMLLYGVTLYNGDGIAPDPVTAYAYVSRAAAQGLASATEALANLDASMPLAQRRKGIAMARAMVRPTPVQKSAPRIATATIDPPAVAARPATARATSSVSGGWRIQLGAFGQRATAEALFAKLRGRVGARQAFYVAAGKVVRLQIGPFDNRKDAAAGCAALGGQACFPVVAR